MIRSSDPSPYPLLQLFVFFAIGIRVISVNRGANRYPIHYPSLLLPYAYGVCIPSNTPNSSALYIGYWLLVFRLSIPYLIEVFLFYLSLLVLCLYPYGYCLCTYPLYTYLLYTLPSFPLLLLLLSSVLVLLVSAFGL
jgi:hypothetical protein